MDGVTILSECTYRGIPLVLVILVDMLIAIGLCALVYSFYRDYKYNHRYKKIRHIILDVILSIFIVGIMILFGTVAYNDYTTIYTDYKVRVDDSILLNEFINNYEIISYDGDTYTVREIEE